MDKRALIIGTSEETSYLTHLLGSLGIVNEILDNPDILKKRLKDKSVCVAIFDIDSVKSKNSGKYTAMFAAVRGSKKDFIILSSDKLPEAVLEAKDAGAADYLIKPFSQREFVNHINAVINKKIKISCIGGGTGLFNVLSAIKDLPNILLTSIVSMSDSGGSSGKLRVDFGILPPGDVRRSLVALSNAPEIMNDLMQYRFRKGDGLSGHNLGNLLLAALSEIDGSMPQAIKRLGDILNIQGFVMPVTETENMLCALFEDDSVVKGEDKIDIPDDRNPNLRIKELWHEPEVQCSAEAYAAIINSDMVIIGPGDLFTSVTTNLIIDGIADAIAKTLGKKVYICNLMTKPGETSGLGASEHVRAIIDALGRDSLDYVIVSDTKFSDAAFAQYKEKGQLPVAISDISNMKIDTNADIIIADVGDEKELVRHDKEKLKNVLQSIIAKISRG